MDGANIQQIEERQHEPHPFKEVTRSRIPVFDKDCQRAKDSIRYKKVNSAGKKALNKTWKGTEYAAAKNEQVYKQDVGGDDPGKNDWLPATIALYPHTAKVDETPFPAL
jgi:hypothetical protein